MTPQHEALKRFAEWYIDCGYCTSTEVVIHAATKALAVPDHPPNLKIYPTAVPEPGPVVFQPRSKV